MANPFTYNKNPIDAKQAQSNVNHWHFEGMITNDEIEEDGFLPAAYRTFIKEMKRDAERELNKIKQLA